MDSGHGRFLEDFAVGDRYRHWPGRTITDSDTIQFSLTTMNRHPLQCGAAFAARSGFGRPLVNSALTLAIVVGMTVDDVSLNAVTTRTEGFKADATVFMSFERSSLVPKRGHGVGERT